MAYFKVNNSRNDDGTYTLSYGKGKGKLTATMSNDDEGWRVYTEDGGRHPGQPGAKARKTMKETKKVWGEWAEKAYAGEDTPSDSPDKPESARPAPPPPPAHKPRTPPPPPARKAAGPPPPPAHLPSQPREQTGLPTPRRAIEDVFYWMLRNKNRVKHPTTGFLLPPWDSVARHFLVMNSDSPHANTFKLVPVKEKTDEPADTTPASKPKPPTPLPDDFGDDDIPF